jgi:Double zinc ribbon
MRAQRAVPTALCLTPYAPGSARFETIGTIVDCASCGHRNVEDARFCGERGASLAAAPICPGCAFQNPGEQKFCSACGHELNGAGRSADEVATDHGAPDAVAQRDPRAHTPAHVAEKIQGVRAEIEGEHKQVTIMFVDIVRSMALSEARWSSLRASLGQRGAL